MKTARNNVVNRVVEIANDLRALSPEEIAKIETAGLSPNSLAEAANAIAAVYAEVVSNAIAAKRANAPKSK